jgi:hypothetical protein
MLIKQHVCIVHRRIAVFGADIAYHDAIKGQVGDLVSHLDNERVRAMRLEPAVRIAEH